MARREGDPAYKRNGHSDAAFSWRPSGAILTAHSSKTIKGEALGYVSAIAYLAPHTMASTKTVCPFSTPACREGCLVGAGMGSLPKQMHARSNRTRLWRSDPAAFLAKVAMEIFDLQVLAAEHGMALAIRLNGTSDIFFEQHQAPNGLTLMETFPGVQFYDYTKAPLSKRGPIPANYHLTYSMADDNAEQAAAYLLAGQSVAVVVPDDGHKVGWFLLGDQEINVVDGDAHDLRFLDQPGSLVMLSPKGKAVLKTDLIRPHAIRELRAIVERKAA